MWTKDCSVNVPASPDAVWAVLGDVAGWSRWNDGVESIELDGPVAVGTKFVMTPPGEDPITSEIIELLDGEAITDRTDFQGLQIRVRHLLSATATGSTTVTYHVEVTGDAPGEVMREVGEGISADFPDVLASLSAQVASQG